jgi:hypothetical protein
MSRASLLLAVAVFALASTAAEARDGCGRGFYYNGYRCAPERYYRPPPDRYYGPPPGYYGPPPPRYYGPPRDEGTVLQFNFGGGDDRRYARPVRGRGGRLTCAQRNYTIQDGLCKPYRGY